MSNSDSNDSTPKDNNDTLGYHETTKKEDNFRARKMKMTLNNYLDSDFSAIINYMKLNCSAWMICKEIGEECKTPHIHGYFEFKNQVWRDSIKKIINKQFWISGCSKGETRKTTYDYLSKQGNYQMSEGFYKPPTPLKLISELRPWQEKVIGWIDGEVEDRVIHWVWDPATNNGKTVFTKYLIAKKNALFSTEAGRKTIANLLKNAKETGRDLNDKTTFIFNMGEGCELNMKSLEALKDGLITNSKYECEGLIFNPPHVIVFSNYGPPDTIRDGVFKKYKIVDNDLEIL